MTDPNAEAGALRELADKARERGDWALADLYDGLAQLVRAKGADAYVLGKIRIEVAAAVRR